MAFPDLHGGPAGICVAHGTGRARFARPFVARSHVMQVFLANFASAPRWVFARREHFIWSFADWASGTRCLPFDVLEKTGIVLGTFIFGFIGESFGLRYSVLFLIIYFVIGIGILLTVEVKTPKEIQH